MDDEVAAQYEVFPYPARDPAEEARRLVTGSPSDPVEMDHFLWNGARDWSQPLRALVAGGGTGDGLVQLAAKLTAAGRAYEITYVDMSRAARRIAEARVAARGLKGVRFVTGSLLDAPDLGRFDYIDCCGVLHHLPDPVDGLTALRGALADGGGLGFMVYAPYGRSGVYPLQEAFGELLQGMAPKVRLAAARDVFGRVPGGHPFKRNTQVSDHRDGDAGFYDLLLHGRDVAMDVPALLAALEAGGWTLSGFVMPGQYDLAAFAEVPEGMDAATQWALAEKLRGTIKVHVGYAAPAGAGVRPAEAKMSAVPHISGGDARALAQGVAQGKVPSVQVGGQAQRIALPREAAPLIGAVDGRRSLAEIAAQAGMDPLRFTPLWGQVAGALIPWGMLRYSGLLRR